jgi:ferredoxin
MERAKLLLAGAVAKARAFRGSGPEHLKASISLAANRRALLTLSARQYHTVPSVHVDRCAADRGCRRCVEACPPRALRFRDGRIELDKERCTSCGLCAGACPAEAVDYPGYAPSELDAQLAALLDPELAELAPRGVLYLCQRSAAAMEGSVARGFRYPTGWLPVVVPCVGMLPVALLLRPLALGADAVGVVPCDGLCPFTQDAAVAERVAFCRALLEQMGAPAEGVRLCPRAGAAGAWGLPEAGSEAGQRARGWAESAPSDRRWAAETVLALARRYGAPADLALPDRRSPLGAVEVDAGGCTGCEACAQVCPTGALAVERPPEGVALTFDAGLCSACGLCAPRCPEAGRGVLRLERAVDRRRLEAGRTTVYRDPTPRCVACGAPIAPAAMMARVAALLGDDYAALAPTIGRYCQSCRGGSSPASGAGTVASGRR